MKKFFASCLSLCLFLSSCNFPQPTATPIPTTDPMQTSWDDRSIFKNGLVASQQPTLEELPGASVYHIEFNIQDTLYQINGHEDVRYTNNEIVPLNEVQLRLFPNILGGKSTISALQVNGQSVTPIYELNNSLMIVPLKQPLEPGQSIVIGMDFAITVPQTVDLNYGVLAYYEDVLALAHAYPMICVYDDKGWNAEIPPQSGDVTYGDAAFYIIKITAPKGLTLVTTGYEISHEETNQDQVSYVASGPARDFYMVASPTYEKTSNTFGEVTINSYAAREMQGGAEMALDVASRAIIDYSQRYAPYPYTEFDIVATPNLALGIEYPSMIAITTRIYDVGDPGSRTRDYMESTVAHEVGHQWFYSLVGNDQLDDPWLDESLTQFATLQYFEDEYGPLGASDFHDSLTGRWAGIGNANIPIGLPVAEYSGPEYSGIVYGRGPLFLEALREKMGVSKFDAFLREYTVSLSWGIATPEYMQSLAETHCACDLDELFNEWVYP